MKVQCGCGAMSFIDDEDVIKNDCKYECFRCGEKKPVSFYTELDDTIRQELSKRMEPVRQKIRVMCELRDKQQKFLEEYI